MRVEVYSDKYFIDVMKIVENFHKEAVCEYESLFDPQVLIGTIKKSDPSNAFLLIVDNACQGILFGTRFDSLINKTKIFQEIIWYVNKPFRTFGVNLLREAEKILKEQGICTMIMAVLENSKTEKIKSFYERLGYKPMETHFVRTL